MVETPTVLSQTGFGQREGKGSQGGESHSRRNLLTLEAGREFSPNLLSRSSRTASLSPPPAIKAPTPHPDARHAHWLAYLKKGKGWRERWPDARTNSASGGQARQAPRLECAQWEAPSAPLSPLPGRGPPASRPKAQRSTPARCLLGGVTGSPETRRREQTGCSGPLLGAARASSDGARLGGGRRVPLWTRQPLDQC